MNVYCYLFWTFHVRKHNVVEKEPLKKTVSIEFSYWCQFQQNQRLAFHVFIWNFEFRLWYLILRALYTFAIRFTNSNCIVCSLGFAFHADAATFNKIIEDDFSERSICELSEIQLFPEQHMMAIVQKGSPLRKMITYG